jgi:hypothetical protein
MADQLGAAETPERTRRRWEARVDGNARLTAATAVVLLVLLAAEGVTVLRVRSLLTPHVVIGLLLVPPILVKIGSTSWKFSLYYLHDPAYRAKGPPVPVLRVLGPFVVVLTILLFASGIALLLAPNDLGGQLLTIHKVSFFLWLAATAVHVLGHLIDTGRMAPKDWMIRSRRLVPGAGRRQLLLVGSLLAGVVLALALKGHVSTYLSERASHHFGGGH